MHTHIPFLSRATLPTAHPNEAFENAAHARCLCCSAPICCVTQSPGFCPLLSSRLNSAGKAIPHSVITYLGLSHLRAFMQAPLGFFLISLISLQRSFSASCPPHNPFLWLLSFSCRLVRAAFLIISAGTVDSTVLASNLHLLPRDSSGFPGWFHHHHLKAAPSHHGLHPTSLQVLAIPPPYLLPALLWLRPSFLTCSNCTPSSCNPAAPCQVISC